MPADPWLELVDAVAAMPQLLDGVPESERADGMRYLLRFLSAGLRVCIEAEDTEAPMLTRSIEHRMSWGLDNPDTTYLYSRLDPARTYRLRGSRGTARHVEVQVNTGHQGDGDFVSWRANWWADGEDMGEEVDITIPPLPDSSFVLIRQYFADWDVEVPASLDLQCVDRDLPPVPLTMPDMDARLALLVQWLREGLRCWDNLSAGLRGSVPQETAAWQLQPFLPDAGASGMKGLAYGMTGWHCQPHEAIVARVAPPSCRYWGVSLCDRYWQSIDFAQRQSSLNDAQAVPDADGAVTFVIAHEDPGVANWLDPGSCTSGTLALRYLDAAGGKLPAMHLRRVDAAGVDGVIDPGVVRVMPAERAEGLRARQAAVAARLRW